MSSEIGAEGAGEWYRIGEWHPSVVLDDFINQVACLEEIVEMTRTPKLGLFDADTIGRAMGWGSYIEEASLRDLKALRS